MSEIKEKIKKLIYKELNELPKGRVLTLLDFQHVFSFVTGESLNNYISELKEVIGELEELGYIRFEGFAPGLGRIIKGINFDEWVRSVEEKGASVAIGVINASQVQVGDHNMITNNLSLEVEDLVKILEILVNEPEKGKNILSKLKEDLGSILSVFELVKRLYEIGKGFL